MLSETVTLADIVADNKDMVRWLRANAEEYAFDPNNIGLWGQSAGGHLALMAGLTDDDEVVGDDGLSSVSARVTYIVDNYGPADLAESLGPIASGERTPGIMDRMVANNLFASTYQEDFRAFAQGLLELSRVTHVDADDPPVLIVHGDADGAVPPEQSRILQRKLADAGASHQVHFVGDADHIFNGATRHRSRRSWICR